MVQLKILGFLFHLFSLFVFFIALNLLLDLRLRGGNLLAPNIVFYDSDLIWSFTTIAILVGPLSIGLLIRKWGKENKLERYLKSILLTDVILITGIGLLLFL
jgi:hypothetical protein